MDGGAANSGRYLFVPLLYEFGAVRVPVGNDRAAIAALDSLRVLVVIKCLFDEISMKNTTKWTRSTHS